MTLRLILRHRIPYRRKFPTSRRVRLPAGYRPLAARLVPHLTDECSNAKMLRGSPSRLSETVPAHYLTFVIRARQRLLEMDDCLTPPAPPRRRRHTGGATWVDVRCGCERLRHDLKNPSTTVDAESSQHSALLFDQRPRSARAAGKWSREKYPATTASTPYRYMENGATALRALMMKHDVTSDKCICN